MPTIKMQPEFFVTFISAKGGTEEWTPKENNIRALFTLAKVKKAAINYTASLLDAGHGRVDWSFTIYEANYGPIGDPNFHQMGYTKGKKLFKFE